MLAMPDQLMSWLGTHYTMPGGNSLEKLHPSTYLLVAAFLLACLESGDPFRLLLAWCRMRPAYIVYALVILGVSGSLVIRHGLSGVAFAADTLLRPALFALLLMLLDHRVRDRLFLFIVGFVVANSCLGIVEVLTNWRLIPYMLGGEPVLEQHFRATAMMGHPLDNALATALTLIFVAGHIHGQVLKGALILLLGLGLLAFGGRTALFAGLMGLVLVAFVNLIDELRSGSFTYMRGILRLLAMLFGPLAIAGVIVGTDIGQRIFAKLAWEGSAQARLEAFRFVSMMTSDEIWFGIAASRFDQLLESLNTVQVVENFWLILLARFGLIAFVPFCIAFIAFLYRLSREGDWKVKVAVVIFLLIASSNNSLATKKPALCILVCLTMTSMVHTRRIRSSVPAGRRIAVRSRLPARRPGVPADGAK